ncbi:MAG: fumarylacetoacetate hydrolase family protein, partial [Pyrinomonadaceae bacterium]
MTYEINETHDPNLKSWVESANDPNTDFPIQNLPFCVFEDEGSHASTMIGVPIGDSIFNIGKGTELSLFQGLEMDSLDDYDIYNLRPAIENRYDIPAFERIRARLIELLHSDASDEDKKWVSQCLIPFASINFLSPFEIGDYTDFYCSIYHATNVGSMFRPDNPLLPNYKFVPIGYHGRASSIVISGTDIRRPKGQNRSDAEKPPVFIPAKSLDYEMELGFFVGQGNELGGSIPIADAEKHIFGLCLVNDWSARDIQAWEYQPLGPFLAKNFATTISP